MVFLPRAHNPGLTFRKTPDKPSCKTFYKTLDRYTIELAMASLVPDQRRGKDTVVSGRGILDAVLEQKCVTGNASGSQTQYGGWFTITCQRWLRCDKWVMGRHGQRGILGKGSTDRDSQTVFAKLL